MMHGQKGVEARHTRRVPLTSALRMTRAETWRLFIANCLQKSSMSFGVSFPVPPLPKNLVVSLSISIHCLKPSGSTGTFAAPTTERVGHAFCHHIVFAVLVPTKNVPQTVEQGGGGLHIHGFV
jgi:hypothetical protein